MRRFSTFALPLLAASTCSLFCADFAHAAPQNPQRTTAKKVRTPLKRVADVRNTSSRVDIVFAIDCSGSMGGVIETAKQKIWSIVNTIARAKPSPVLRIGLLAYGDGQRTFRSYPLSDDLDAVYGNLMTFKDEGWSDEYVGLSVHKALHEMQWGRASRQLNVLYVVGNETARQGPPQFDYARTTPQARERNILVNAIYCGSSGGEETWREMAALGGGKYLHIAGDGGAITIATPYDRKLDVLNTQLNTTYLAYGARGRESLALQEAQDSNSRSVGGAPTTAARAAAKSTAQYNNRRWDLVDAAREKSFDLKKIERSQLPTAMQKMTPAQQKAFIAQNAQKRGAIQKQIRALSQQRDNYIAAQMKKRKLSPKNALDEAIRGSVINQAKARGYKF